MGRKFIRKLQYKQIGKVYTSSMQLITHRPACKFGRIPSEMSGMAPEAAASPGAGAVPMAAHKDQ